MNRRCLGRLWLIGCLLLSAGGLSADPPPVEENASPDPALDTKELAELALEHSRARDALLAVEARLALLAEKVFDSRLVVRFEGETEPPFRLVRLELDLDGALAYRKEFDAAPTIQSIKLFDGYLPPGRHVLRLRLYARGPDDPRDAQPGYFSGSGMAVHLRNESVCTAVFEAEQDGDSPGARVLKAEEPEGSWEIEIHASATTEGA